MTDEKPENIDQFFKDQFEEIEVRYNTAHWSQLQQALAGAAAAGAVASTSSDFWWKVSKFLKGNKLLMLVVGMTVPVVLGVYLLQREEPVHFIPTMNPMHNESPVFEPVQDEADSAHFSNGSATDTAALKRNVTLPLALDSIRFSRLTLHDSLDSARVDTTKALKNFIFW